MKLIYLYVGKNIRTIENLGMNFSQSFEVSYQDKQLRIEKKTPVKVFPSAIDELTSIVGRNGSGKSTILDLLYKTEIEEMNLDSEGDDVSNALPYGMFKLYHIADQNQTGYFYLDEYSKSPMVLHLANDNFSGPQKTACKKKFLFSYDYSGNEITKISICRQNDSLQKTVRQWGITVNKTNILYHPSVKMQPWFSTEEYRNVNGTIPGRIISPTAYSLLTYAYDATIHAGMGKEKEEKNNSAFENLPKGLRMCISLEILALLPDVDILGAGPEIRKRERIEEWKANWKKLEVSDHSLVKKFLLELLYNLLYELQNPLHTDEQILNAIRQDAEQFVSDYLQKKADTHLDQDLLFYISAILHSCMGYNLSKDTPEDSAVSPYLVIYHLAYVLAFESDEYSQFIDACFYNTVLRNDNGMTSDQTHPWRIAYKILQDKRVEKPMISAINWKHHLSSDLLTLNNGEYLLTIPLSSYEKELDEPHGTRNVIVDSLFRLLYITERMEKDYFSEREKTRYLPKVKIRGISSGEMDFIDLYASIYGGLSSIYKVNPAYKRCDHYEDEVILILDEPDATFHPEWSRKFIYSLTTTLNQPPFIYYPCKYQLILTTHSPIVLSDLPAPNIRLLDVDEEGKAHVTESQYGLMSNINDIMVSSFFVDKPFGSFAESYVNSLFHEIDLYQKRVEKAASDLDHHASDERGSLQGQDTLSGSESAPRYSSREELEAAIEMISEPYIKSVLRKRLDQADGSKASRIKSIEDEILRLQGQLDDLRKK